MVRGLGVGVGALAAGTLALRLLACSGSAFTAATPEAGPPDAPGVETACNPAALPTASFCAEAGAAHMFCDDFDQECSLGADPNWTSNSTLGGVTFLEGPSPPAESPPNALVARTPLEDGGSSIARAAMDHLIPGAVSEVRASAQVFVPLSSACLAKTAGAVRLFEIQ